VTGAIVLDIEGTTSSLSYVRERLFPYARDRVDEWIRRPDPAIRDVIAEVRAVSGRPEATVDEVAATLVKWIDEDVKATALKTLQGLIWEAGYAAGHLVSHVYDDVPGALRAWRDQGIRLYVYSSGSVLAQRLWFAHTRFGDLSGLFCGHYDTRNAGPKRDPSSYHAIAAEIGLAPGDLLFLSDMAGELDAARGAGWPVVQVVRADDGTIPAPGHVQVSGLDQVRPDHEDAHG
jgi:enolase-phosphatase E1